MTANPSHPDTNLKHHWLAEAQTCHDELLSHLDSTMR